MKVHLLIAAPAAESVALYDSLLASALELLALDVATERVTARAEVTDRVRAGDADLLLLDWLVAGADTPRFVRDLATLDPRLRSIVVMPLQLRQYRACVWDAGACVAVPKEHLDQEWLLSMLCLVQRAMEREERARRSQED